MTPNAFNQGNLSKKKAAHGLESIHMFLKYLTNKLVCKYPSLLPGWNRNAEELIQSPVACPASPIPPADYPQAVARLPLPLETAGGLFLKIRGILHRPCTSFKDRKTAFCSSTGCFGGAQVTKT